MKLISAYLFFMSFVAFADERCYLLSTNNRTWTDHLCVTEKPVPERNLFEIQLKNLNDQQLLILFKLDLIFRPYCFVFCNLDIFGVRDLEDSVFNDFKIAFNGGRAYNRPWFEEGTVSIGPQKYFYRSLE